MNLTNPEGKSGMEKNGTFFDMRKGVTSPVTIREKRIT
jgi:hypothetical protein